MKLPVLGAAVLAAVMVVPVNAADEDGKKKKKRGQRNTVVTQLLKQLEPVGLTDEQTKKAKELGTAAAAKIKSIRDEAGITAELTKKRTEAQKSLKDSGKKRKDMVAAISEAAGFSEAQAAALVKVNQARTEFQKGVIALLSDEQKAKLPERLQRVAKQKSKRKGKGKKKEKADA